MKEELSHPKPSPTMISFDRYFTWIVLVCVLASIQGYAQPVRQEQHPFDTVLVSVPYLEATLDRDGRVPLYGIYFKGRYDIDERSIPVLATIADYLSSRSEIKLYVVGHAADTGSFEYGMRESDVRALAIVRYLINVHGVDKARLTYYGVGPLCPVVPITTPLGVARNTRYELVTKRGR